MQIGQTNKNDTTKFLYEALYCLVYCDQAACIYDAAMSGRVMTPMGTVGCTACNTRFIISTSPSGLHGFNARRENRNQAIGEPGDIPTRRFCWFLITAHAGLPFGNSNSNDYLLWAMAFISPPS